MSVAEIKAIVSQLSEEERAEVVRFLDAENEKDLKDLYAALPILKEIDGQKSYFPAPLAIRHDSEEGWLASFQAAIHDAIAEKFGDDDVRLPSNLSTTWKRVKTHRLLSHHDL